MHKKSTAIVELFFKNVLQSSIFGGHCIPFLFYLLIKGLILETLSGYNPIFSCINVTIAAY